MVHWLMSGWQCILDRDPVPMAIFFGKVLVDEFY